ncbi:MAG: VapE domain-containing protein [Cyanobacteria bacterium J06554_6]
MNYEDATGASVSKVSKDNPLAALRRIGPDVCVPGSHGDGRCNRDRNDRKEALHEAKRYVREARCKKQAYWGVFEAIHDHRDFHYNSWTNTYFLYDRETTTGKLRNRLDDALDICCPLSEGDFQRKLETLRDKRTKDPGRTYLNSLERPKETPDEPVEPFSTEEWSGMAKRLFGGHQPELAQVFLTRWLISSVARILRPGCDVPSVLVLKGKQGAGKTSFFESLAIPGHFGRAESHLSDDDLKRRLNMSHIVEMAELEGLTGKKAISALKVALDNKVDTVRRLYGEDHWRWPRHCVFGGSTNESTFLNDPTGSRRFWVIDMGDFKRDREGLEWLQDNRDLIWATALALYRQGEPWHLTEEEEGLSEAQNRSYTLENPLQEDLERYLGSLQEAAQNPSGRNQEPTALAFTTSDLLSLLGFAKAQHQRNTRNLKAAMEALGYSKSLRRIGGSRIHCWTHPDLQGPLSRKPLSALMAVVDA